MPLTPCVTPGQAAGPISQRGQDWIRFSEKVLNHIEEYTVPQYGDKGDDHITECSVPICLDHAKKYVSRYGRQSREGQQTLDFLKMAHWTQCAFTHYLEGTDGSDHTK